jgi:alpha/beta superfamily hydrolase
MQVMEDHVDKPGGERLALSWHPAGHLAGPGAPVVVLCHGMEAHRGGKVARLAARLQQCGVSALRFDHAGCGESTGDHHPIDLRRRVDDLCAAVGWVRAHVGDGDGMLLGLGGSSMGAAVTLVGAVQLGATAWAGIATPVSLWPEVDAAARRYAGRALVVWGDRDEVVPPSDSAGLCRRWGPRAEALEFPAGDHRLADHVPVIAERFAAFFPAALPGRPRER